jgi:hypothetical protein
MRIDRLVAAIGATASIQAVAPGVRPNSRSPRGVALRYWRRESEVIEFKGGNYGE